MPDIKQKLCKAEGCDNTFPQWNSTEVACSIPCALAVVDQKKKKVYKQETARMKSEARKTSKPYQLKKTEEACNAYIRERDKGKPCVSCGAEVYTMTAGHYRSVGAHPELRYEETNIAGQCWWNCNRNKSGNIIEFRKELILRLGETRLAWIEGPHDSKNYTLDDLARIREHYKDKLKALIDSEKL